MKKILLFSLLTLILSFKSQAQKKPNVVVIYTDDHRYTGVHALGGQAVKTPAFDDLALNGIAFTNAYIMGAFSGATCIPSRAMLLTGRNLFELDGQGRTIPEEHTMMGETFIEAGYYAYHVGKWHQDMKSLARSAHSGAKVSGKPSYLTDQFRMPYSDWQADGNYKKENAYLLTYNDQGEVVKRALNKNDKAGPTGTEKIGPHVSEVLAEEASDFIRAYAKEKPFFMYLAFPTPHDPRQAPKKYKAMYPEENMVLPPSYMSQHPFDNGHIVLRDEKLAEWPRTEAIAKKHLSDYYAIITHLDAQIGRVINALKASGAYQNTIIVLAGDSGLAVGNHGLMGKQNIYDEDGTHIPFIISGGLLKQEDKGRREDALCYNFDIMPTLCDMAGIKTPASVSGKSLLPLINNEVESVRTNLYYAYRQHQRAYRKGNFKLIEYVRAPDKNKKRGDIITGSRVTQLFDLSKDPWETFNLADFPEYAAKVVSMRNEMKSKATELGDTADGKRTSVDFWKYWD
ncbi:sulfatase-like hydrolase/transferase [Aquimarina sp. ERC-38]|uniref:sulfatase-like hydrolase/transferase n=1 Tax=Aquimarina sp. ERC-38 TaxID=2949996 RepID=UPI00224773A7|nr:sulfatase-like hydrolase/transferase [Aquimarina sp. ERC-38]UZO82302.1 sulfatase-like hydrolase/transferase [Aquimarina sp. ERC-38]